jgi:very-short-patch-repair endonuclease
MRLVSRLMMNREAELRKWGDEIIRLTNEELFQNIEKVLQTIKQKVEELITACVENKA